jgi:hypothetical protein
MYMDVNVSVKVWWLYTQIVAPEDDPLQIKYVALTVILYKIK